MILDSGGRILVWAFVGVTYLASPVLGQENTPELNVPAKISLSDRQIVVDSDGSSTITSHTETKILNPNIIPLLGQTKIDYSEALQQVDVSNAYTLKPDGRKIAVSPDAIVVQQKPVSQSAPQLNDIKQKVVIFPDVEVGDTLAYDVSIKSKPQISGNFTYDAVYPTALPIDDASISVSIPKNLASRIDSRSMKVTKSSEGDRDVYKVDYSNQHPVADAGAQSQFDLAPRFSVSTFHDYDAVAASYAALVAPKMVVDSAIQAKADEIVAGASDRREQAKKIYDWISYHVRYVALEFGQGGIVPHSADYVLANGFGDCKDQAILFVALLQARGIPANLALINATNTYSLAKAPTLAPFNHVIVWIPELRLYADTTGGRIFPFGALANAEYGKQVLHIADKAGALYVVPVNDPATVVSYKLIIVADDPGHINSNSSITATGNFAVPLRTIGLVAQGQDGAKVADLILKKSQMPRATGMLTAPALDADTPSYTISANYSTPGVMVGLARDANVGMQDHLLITSPFSEIFFGPLIAGKYREADAAPCFNGHANDDETFRYPTTRQLTKLPADSKVSSSHVSYTSHWTTDGSSVSVHRELFTHFDQVLCSGSAKIEMIAVADQLHSDLSTTFSVPRMKGESQTAPPSQSQ